MVAALQGHDASMASSIRRPPTLDELYTSDPQPSGATFARMEFATLETAALAHVDDSYYYGAYCGKCKHRHDCRS